MLFVRVGKMRIGRKSKKNAGAGRFGGESAKTNRPVSEHHAPGEVIRLSPKRMIFR